MDKVVAITDAELAELKRLWDASHMMSWAGAMIDAFPGLVARIEAAAMRWRPISEAPKDGTKMDLWTENGRIADCWWENGYWKHWWIGGFDNMGPCRIGEIPTHYLPLPAPPEATR